MAFRDEQTVEEPLTSFEESDEMLMVRLMAGAQDAFDQLFERYEGRIRSFAYRFIGNREAAEDITQEVFLKLYRNPRAFDPRGRFVTWMFAVARNACIDHLRLKRLPTVPVGAVSEDDERYHEPASPAAWAPEEVALFRELQERMQEILATLSKKLREAFVLCAIQGLSYEEAAQVIGCPVKTVSSRLSRARDHFFQSFRRYLDDGASRKEP